MNGRVGNTAAIGGPRRRRWMRASLGAVLVLGLGCSRQERAESAKDPGAGRVMSEAPEDVAEHMALHDAQGLAMRDAVVRGELHNVSGPAGWIAEHMADQVMPDAWKASVGEMRRASKALAEAENLPDAARSLAEVAAACGRCHQRISGPEIFITDPPAQTSEVVGRMERHVWATDRMWDGIVGPSNAAWLAGSEAIQDVPLRRGDLAAGGGLPPEAEKLAQRVKTLGTEASQASSAEERVRVYGELLSTCANCHRLLGQGS